LAEHGRNGSLLYKPDRKAGGLLEGMPTDGRRNTTDGRDDPRSLYPWYCLTSVGRSFVDAFPEIIRPRLLRSGQPRS
jgi:hypothetical protein